LETYHYLCFYFQFHSVLFYKVFWYYVPCLFDIYAYQLRSVSKVAGRWKKSQDFSDFLVINLEWSSDLCADLVILTLGNKKVTRNIGKSLGLATLDMWYVWTRLLEELSKEGLTDPISNKKLVQEFSSILQPRAIMKENLGHARFWQTFYLPFDCLSEAEQFIWINITHIIRINS